MCLSFFCSLHSFQLSVFQNILKQFCFRVVAWNQSYLLPTIFPYNVSRHTDACFRIVGCACLSKPSSRGAGALLPPRPRHLSWNATFITNQCHSHVSAHSGQTPLDGVIHITYCETSFLFILPGQKLQNLGHYLSSLPFLVSSTRFLIKANCSSAFLAQ